MKVQALNSICLWSENPDKLAEFYANILNLPFDKKLDLSNDRGVQFKIGNTYFFVGYHDKVNGKTEILIA